MKKLEDLILTYKDFPKKGIDFKDVLGIIQEPEVFKDLILKMSDSKIIDIISAEKFATWSNKLSINEVPPEVIKKIKLVFLDSMGLIFASRNEKYIKSLKNSFLLIFNSRNYQKFKNHFFH